MRIIGPDALVFGVDDVAACTQYLTDYGLTPVGVDARGGRFEALDGTAIVVRRKDDPTLPKRLRDSQHAARDRLRRGRRGDAGRDRGRARKGPRSAARRTARCKRSTTWASRSRFQVTVRRPLDLPGETVNAPGAAPQRAGTARRRSDDRSEAAHAVARRVLRARCAPRRSASTSDWDSSARIASRVGPFLRPAGTLDHHTLFMIQTPPFMKGCEHFTFHMGGPTEMMLAGARFIAKGYQSFWGPGRHKFGSNWFWYFNSPLGCHVEYDADMDLHDDAWVAREAPMGADASQLFLFPLRDKWAPGGPPPPKGVG